MQSRLIYLSIQSGLQAKMENQILLSELSLLKELIVCRQQDQVFYLILFQVNITLQNNRQKNQELQLIYIKQLKIHVYYLYEIELKKKLPGPYICE